MPPKSTTKAEPIHGADAPRPVFAQAEKSAKATKPKPRGKHRPSELPMTPVPNKETAADDADESGAPPVLVSDGPFNSRDYHWYTHTVRQVAEIMQLPDYTTGVDRERIAERRATFGDNVIPMDTGKNVLLMFVSHFVNSISLILAVVAGISVYFKDWAEFGVVVFVIIFNGAVGFWQEYSAEKSIQGLKDMTAGSAKVVRSGRVEVVEIDDVVVGDVVILEQGASVAADLRLFEANNLEIDESLLTGEAMPVLKHVKRIHDPELDCGLGDRKNLAFRQTLVTSGIGKGIVVAGGKDTEMGKISERLTDHSGSSETPLQQKMKHMMWVLFGVCFILALIVFFVNGGWWDFHESTILYAAAVAIAVLPEALVAVITVAMTISVRRMATQKCIVRKLAALEVLGNVTDICSDKTGTLTENKMVAKLVLIGDRLVEIAGESLGIHATFSVGDDDLAMTEELRRDDVERFFRCAALCSTTKLHREGDVVVGTGNPTEIAIQAMCWKARAHRDRWADAEGFADRGEFPFDSTVKRMSSAYLIDDESYVCVKGASERVLALCEWRTTGKKKGDKAKMTAADRARIERHIEDMAALGLRTICLAERCMDDGAVDVEEHCLQTFNRDVVEQRLVFLGVVGIYDPPRKESGPSVHICQEAGIKVRMLTGDHASTAEAISKGLRIVDGPSEGRPATDVITGPAFDKLTDAERDAMPDLPSVVGRCSPDSKVNMIEALHRRGRVVAMTGDGFNDSPSIKIADIGCAMGSGTDVTKGVADIVITDDNFATIVRAVAEGRRIASSITKFVIHLLSGNVSEVIVLVLGLPFRHEGRSIFILSPIEILWLNMFTGSPPAMGLSLDEADDDILRVPPNTGGFFTRELVSDTFLYGIFLGSCSLSSFAIVLYGFNDGPAGKHCNESEAEGCEAIWTARSTAFTVLYLGLLLHAYNVRGQRTSVFRMKWFDNKWLWGSCLFGVVTLIPIQYVPAIAKHVFLHQQLTWHWGVVVVALIIFMIFSELYKVAKNFFDPIERTEVAKATAPEDEEADREQVGINNMSMTRDPRGLDAIAHADVDEYNKRLAERNEAEY